MSGRSARSEIEWHVLTTLRAHIYRADRPPKDGHQDDPGWHPCTCGWEGYWSAYQPHVADAVVSALLDAAIERKMNER